MMNKMLTFAGIALILLSAAGCQKEKVDTASDFKYTVEKNEIIITGYKGDEEDVILPGEIDGKPVTKIGKNAFKDYTFTSAVLPDSLTSIGLGAFEYCTPLADVNIPGGVTIIDDFAFNGCGLLTNVIIPEGVTSVNQGVFQNCDSLVNITIPNGATSIGSYAFGNCVSLISVTIPDSVASIGNYAFGNCVSLISVTIPDDVTIIEGAFYGCDSIMGETRERILQVNPKAFDKNW